jgi:hypothetical protein
VSGCYNDLQEVMLFLIESRSESSFSTETLCRQVGPGLAYAQASDRNHPYSFGKLFKIVGAVAYRGASGSYLGQIRWDSWGATTNRYGSTQPGLQWQSEIEGSMVLYSWRPPGVCKILRRGTVNGSLIPESGGEWML